MALEDAHMVDAPPTPADDVSQEPTAPVIDYSPATVPYNEAFENELMNAILYPSSHSPRNILRDDAKDSSSAPIIPASSLPIPLVSSLRTHPSPIPGISLTHLHGHYTGGPGPTPSTIDAFARSFIQEFGIEDAGQLERVVEEKIRERVDVVRERMREREEALVRNKGIERELEELALQRSAELRVLERIGGGTKG